MSRIEAVTLYGRGARVRREVRIAAPVPAVVRVDGLPLVLEDDSVRVEVEGEGRVTAVRVGVDVPAQDAPDEEEPPEVRAAQLAQRRAVAALDRIDRALAAVRGAQVSVQDTSDEPPAAFTAILDARRALVGARAERERVLVGQRVIAAEANEAARRTLQGAIDRARRASSARPAKAHELRKHVELACEAAGELVVHVEYFVVAARWAPSYVARLDGDGVRVELRALVAQRSGEDWSGVPLKLSTAKPDQFAPLPQLHAQRFGRRQPDAAPKGFRAPPAGATELYADYDLAFGEPRTGRTSGFEETPTAEFAAPQQDMRASFAPPVGSVAPPPAPARAMVPMAPGGAPQSFGAMKSRGGASRVMAFSEPAPKMMKKVAYDGGGGGGDLDDLEMMKDAAPLRPTPRLDYADLVLAPPSSPLRGKLVASSLVHGARDGEAAADRAAAQAMMAIGALRLPRGYATDWAFAYDYAYGTDGAVDVASDGAWHSIAVTALPSTAKLRHVTVPRVQSDAFRIAELANPFGGPLLPGPIDVYDRGTFLVTSAADFTPPGATVEIGLGVDGAVKIARNTEFAEEQTGVLRGKLGLHHGIRVDVENLSPRAIDLEVRERVPVVREGDDDVEVVVGSVSPPWEAWTPDPDAPKAERLRGGHRWRVTVAAGAKQTLRAAYDVKIAAKHELVGGNRRES
ncbi:MAG TPA: mucoidy inhibitor MuiA family protein [Kofleriaceae bacterium]|jgi:hypothetical protein